MPPANHVPRPHTRGVPGLSHAKLGVDTMMLLKLLRGGQGRVEYPRKRKLLFGKDCHRVVRAGDRGVVMRMRQELVSRLRMYRIDKSPAGRASRCISACFET